MRRLPGLLLVAVLALAAAPAASAHAKLIAAEPANGATLATAPASVRLFFDDPVAVGPGNAVVAADHSSVLAGSPRLERKDRLLVLGLRPHLPNGDYSVSWRVFSDDGHLESGVLAFRVGAAAAGAGAPQSVLEPAATRPGAVDILARWLFLGGILIAGGTALFYLLVSRAAVRRAATTMAAALLAVVLGGAWLVYAGDGAATASNASRRLPSSSRSWGASSPPSHAPGRISWHRHSSSRSPCSSPRRSRATLTGPGTVAGSRSPQTSSMSSRRRSGPEVLQLALLLRGGYDERAVRRFSLSPCRPWCSSPAPV